MARAAEVVEVEPEADETPADEVLTGEAVALDLRPGGVALRLASGLIDFLVYVGAYVVVLLLLIWIALAARAEDAVFGIIAVAAFVLCVVIAPITVETLSRGKSLGRLALGLRIVRDDGGAIGLRHAVVRGLAGILEVFSTFGTIAFITTLLSPRTKRLGDLMAGTFAQYERVSRAVAAPVGLPSGMEGWAAVADVARMPEPLARRIARFLHEAGHYEPTRRGALAASLAAEAAPYVAPVPPVHPELLLAAVTAVRRDREARALALEAQRLERLAPALQGLPHDFPRR
jgi:uncharacterized RDD family membrane protein YckC